MLAEDRRGERPSDLTDADGRAGHLHACADGDADRHANANANADPNNGGDSYSDVDANSDSHKDANGNTHVYTTVADGDYVPDPIGDEHKYGNTNGDTHQDIHADQHADANGNRHGDEDLNGHADEYAGGPKGFPAVSSVAGDSAVFGAPAACVISRPWAGTGSGVRRVAGTFLRQHHVAVWVGPSLRDHR